MLTTVCIIGLRIHHFQPYRHGLQYLAQLLQNAVRDVFSRMHSEPFEREEVAAAQRGVKPIDCSTTPNSYPETESLESDDKKNSVVDPLGTNIGLDIENHLRKLCMLVC